MVRISFGLSASILDRLYQLRIVRISSGSSFLRPISDSALDLHFCVRSPIQHWVFIQRQILIQHWVFISASDLQFSIGDSFQRWIFNSALVIHFSIRSSIQQNKMASKLEMTTSEDLPFRIPPPTAYLSSLSLSLSCTIVLTSYHHPTPWSISSLHLPATLLTDLQLASLSISCIIDTSVPSFPNRFLPFFLSPASNLFYRFGPFPHLYVPFWTI